MTRRKTCIRCSVLLAGCAIYTFDLVFAAVTFMMTAREETLTDCLVLTSIPLVDSVAFLLAMFRPFQAGRVSMGVTLFSGVAAFTSWLQPARHIEVLGMS